MNISHVVPKTRFPAFILLASLVAAGGPPELPVLAQGAGQPPAPSKPARDRGGRATGDEPVELQPRPREAGGPLPLEPGEVHLLALLQYLADASGTMVVYPGGKGVTAEVVQVARRTDMADAAAVRSVLGRAGYDVSEENYQGRKVQWVSRQLKPSGKRGAILRPGEEPPASSPDGVAPEAGAPAPGGGGARLFTRQEGGRTSYLVLFETPSRAEAEEAYQALRQLRETKPANREEGRSPGRTGGKAKTRP